MDYDLFMGYALDSARQALSAGEFPVGCVLVADGRVVASGARKGTTGDSPNEIDHAEVIILRQLVDLNAPLDRRKAVLFSTMEPCLMCYGAILLSGIGTLVYAYEDVMGGGTGCDLTRLNPLYRDRKVRIVPRIRRSESLTLFKRFFSNPENRYWSESLLARYTMEQ
jgi:tRNA(adenine34) deaminase